MFDEEKKKIIRDLIRYYRKNFKSLKMGDKKVRDGVLYRTLFEFYENKIYGIVDFFSIELLIAHTVLNSGVPLNEESLKKNIDFLNKKLKEIFEFPVEIENIIQKDKRIFLDVYVRFAPSFGGPFAIEIVELDPHNTKINEKELEKAFKYIELHNFYYKKAEYFYEKYFSLPEEIRNQSLMIYNKF